MDTEKRIDKQNVYRHVGSIQQVANIRPVTYTEGRAEQMKAYEVKNGSQLWEINVLILQMYPIEVSILIFFPNLDLQEEIITTLMEMKH